jgi:hypothetical protein
MKRNIVRTIFFATLLLGVAVAASAQQNDGVCTNASIAGMWGTTMTGTLILPTGAVPFAAVSRATYDFAGNYWGTQTRSNNGAVSRITFRGTYTVNPDCTGTKTTKSYDQAGNLLNTATQDFVLVNDAEEIVEIFTSNTLPNGTTIQMVVTGNSKRLFPNSIWEHVYERVY